jgi:hypothetical protein
MGCGTSEQHDPDDAAAPAADADSAAAAWVCKDERTAKQVATGYEEPCGTFRCIEGQRCPQTCKVDADCIAPVGATVPVKCAGDTCVF